MELRGSRRVTAPDGAAWRVGRVWFGGRQLRSWQWRRKVGIDIAQRGSGALDVIDGSDLEAAVAFLVAAVAVLFILIPVLLFGIELIILGVVLAAGLVGSSLFGRPWTVAAARSGDRAPAALWRVKGWRSSRELIAQVCVDLEARGQLASDFPQAAFVERVDERESSAAK